VTKSADRPVAVLAADPGVLTTDASGTGQGAILNTNGTTGDMTVNRSSHAAAKGTTIAIYITGFGTTSCVEGTAGNVCTPGAADANLMAGIVARVIPVAVTIDAITAPWVGHPQAPIH